MKGHGFESRKKFVKDVNKALRTRAVVPRTNWPALKEGEFVWMVKNLKTRELKEVVAVHRFEAEKLAFPEAPLEGLRSMPIHSNTKVVKKKEEEEDG